MRQSEKLIRLVTAVLAALVGAMFVHGYSGIQYHNLVEHMNCSLPEPTLIVAAAAPWAYVVPALALILGAFLYWQETALRIIFSASWLFALAWPLACLFCWEAPKIIL